MNESRETIGRIDKQVESDPRPRVHTVIRKLDKSGEIVDSFEMTLNRDHASAVNLAAAILVTTDFNEAVITLTKE